MGAYSDMDGYELQHELARRGIEESAIVESKGKTYLVTQVKANSRVCRVELQLESGRARRRVSGSGLLEAIDAGRAQIERSGEDLYEGRNMSVGFDKFMDDIIERESRASQLEEARLKAAQEDTWGRKREMRSRESVHHLMRWGK